MPGTSCAGGCPDGDEAAAWGAVRRWLAAWKRQPQNPAAFFEAKERKEEPEASEPSALKELETEKAGALEEEARKGRRRTKAVQFELLDEMASRGPEEKPESTDAFQKPKSSKEKKARRGRPPKERKTAEGRDPGELVKPRALGRAREQVKRELADGSALFGDRNYQLWIKEQSTEALMQKLSEGTRHGYSSAWRQWVLYRAMQKKDPWLEGRTREERKMDEDALIEFATFLSRVMGRTDGTIKQRLFAIRYAHISEGYGDPTLHRSRLWATLGGLHRWQGIKVKRKRPVTPRMLEWLKERLESGDAGFGKADAAAMWLVALSTGFFFLLRASEYLVQDNRTWSEERVLHGNDVEARTGNQTLRSFKGAEEVVIKIKGSKTDQYNVGCVRNQYRSGKELDPVGAFEEYERHFPHRIRGTEAHLPLFRWQDGSFITRQQLQLQLEIAAIAEGVDPQEYGSHSLRIGGATAMYHVVGDLQQVRRFGRWATDTFHAYLWEAHEPMRPISAKMAEDNSALTEPKGLGASPGQAV